MKVSIEKAGANVIARVEGSIDSKTAPDLQQNILNVAGDGAKLVLDFTNVSFVSSAGLRVLLMVYRQQKAKNGKVILVGVSEEIKDVMFMTGFISFFELTDSLDQALAG